jgi:exodeoxyribonuclease-3
MSSLPLLERAYELARSGRFSTITEIRNRLGKEGYIQISSYLEGLSVQRALKKLMAEALPGDPADDQARYIEAAVNGVLISSIYLPNCNPAASPKVCLQAALFERLITHAAQLTAAGVPVVLAGDYNVVPTEADIWPGHHEQDNALLQPQTRAAYQRLLDQGWTDALRVAQPEGPLWTFWGYLRHRWPNDKGMRLDHLLVSRILAPSLRATGVDRAVRGLDGASDHAPTWINLEFDGSP